MKRTLSISFGLLSVVLINSTLPAFADCKGGECLKKTGAAILWLPKKLGEGVVYVAKGTGHGIKKVLGKS